VTYPGGKNGPGVYQTIINQIPPHRVYIEPFAGSAAIYRHKRSATLSYLIDKDPSAVAALSPSGDVVGTNQLGRVAALTTVICADARGWLKAYDWRGDEFVYADPPYLDLTRLQGRQIYRHEIQSENDHNSILDILATLPCSVMISGYWSELYGRRLGAWRVVRFQGMNRAGNQTGECLWMNYSEPVALHDYSYLGRNSRERQDVKRMKERWLRKLRGMPTVKRQALLAAISELV